MSEPRRRAATLALAGTVPAALLLFWAASSARKAAFSAITFWASSACGR
jgi:hypothetical protein